MIRLYNQSLLRDILLIKEGRQGIFADLNSVEIHRNRIYLGGPVFCGPRMSENILSAFFPYIMNNNVFSFSSRVNARRQSLIHRL